MEIWNARHNRICFFRLITKFVGRYYQQDQIPRYRFGFGFAPFMHVKEIHPFRQVRLGPAKGSVQFFFSFRERGKPEQRLFGFGLGWGFRPSSIVNVCWAAQCRYGLSLTISRASDKGSTPSVPNYKLFKKSQKIKVF